MPLPSRDKLRRAAVATVAMSMCAGGLALSGDASSPAAASPVTTASAQDRSSSTAGAWVPLAAPSVLKALVPVDPFRSRAMRKFLSGRSGNITAAVYDVGSNTTFDYHPDDREQTASIVKVDILATLLAQAQARHEPLSDEDEDVATGMIEESDNDDATTLWDEEGGPGAVASFDARLDMTQTTPNVAWGLTETTPRDQLRLLRHIALPNHVLHYDYRESELYLMEHVISEDYWGISAGPAPGVTVAIKNGWLPVANGWQINSIGMIHGDHRFYLIAVMTNGNADEDYGIDTIEGISRIVWSYMRERFTSPSTGPSGTTGPTGASSASGASGATSSSG
jgi:hypothetical protein